MSDVRVLSHIAIRIVWRLLLLAAVCLIASALAMAGLLLHWRLQGEHVLGVQTGSMRPLFAPGDAVIVREIETTKPSFKVGQIVAYQSLRDSSVVVTHRIVAVDRQTGWLTTKGDALSKNDPTIPPRLVLGRVRAIAPGLGRLLAVARQPVALTVLVYLPGLWLIGSELRRLYNQLGRVPYRAVRVGKQW